MQLVPGQISANGIAPGTSGSVVGGDNLVFPLPLNGSQILTVGKARNGRVPMVVSAGSTHFAPAPLSTLGAIGCLCWRGVTAKTCGGTLFEADGTESIDCTPVFTMGDAVCSGKSPCTPVYGAGNAAAGIVGCEGLDGVNLWVTYDAGGSRGGRVAPVIQLAGTGGPGSAALLSRVALGSKGDNQCARTDAAYGPDQVFCTGDDPLRYQGGSFTMPLVTGTAAGEVANANGIDGRRLGPFQVTGASFSCAAVGRGEVVGAALAGASTVPLGSFGDAVITNQVVAAAPTVPTRSATPTATRPRPSPTPVVEVAVGSATGKPGDQVSIAITLHTSGVLVSTVSSTVTVGLNDIAFVGCTLNPELPKYLGISVSTLFVQTIVSDPDTFSRVPIPDGAVLYTCTLDIGAGALSGTTELSIQSIVVYSTGDAEIPARGGNGAIVVEGEATATPQPTLTPTPTLRPAAPAIVAGVATGRPGDTVTIEVGVRTGGRRVSMAEHDLSYDGLSVPFIARVGGAPDCTANPAVAATTSSFAFLGTRFTGTLRAAVASNNNAAGFADGALLYTCRAEISGVSVPAAYPLQVSQVTLKDPAGAQLSDAVGVDGAILVSAP